MAILLICTENLRKLNYSENMNDEAVEQWIKDSKLENLTDDDIVLLVTCDSEETILKNVSKVKK